MAGAVAELADLSSFDLLEQEVTRLDRFLSSLGEAGWERPTRCAGWRVRDLVAHLAGNEEYNKACLDDDLPGLFQRAEKAGVIGFDGFNEWMVGKRAELSAGDVLAEWRDAVGQTIRRLRELGPEGTLSTSIGPYPAGKQAFYLASETAIHADDIAVPTEQAEAPARLAWRVRVSRFCLVEERRPVEVEPRGDGFVARAGERAAELSAADLVEAAAARLPDDHPLDPELREALSTFA